MNDKDLLSYTEKLIKLFEESSLNKMEYSDVDLSISFDRTKEVQIVSSSDSQVTKVVEDNQGKVEWKNVVKSPLVGTFYSSSTPDSSEFVKVGDRVVSGQVLCIVEAMKVMNEILAPCDGVVAEILVNNADNIEYDQVLFNIK